jgi:hypothetical protein
VNASPSINVGDVNNFNSLNWGKNWLGTTLVAGVFELKFNGKSQSPQRSDKESNN